MVATPALSQADGEEQLTASERCQTLPDKGAGDHQDPAGDPFDKLQDCSGVLKPPATGDGEITEPTPDIGKTPMIRPGELPNQQQPE
nr:hypothetical protein [Agrobacterium vitis]